MSNKLQSRIVFFAVVALIVAGLLWFIFGSPGCAESSLAKRIESARLAGDTAEVARLESQIPQAQQSDETMWNTGGALAGIIGGPILGLLVGVSRAAAMRRKAVQGVTTAIEAGKSASPEFAAAFEGRVGDTIRANMPDDVAKIVAAFKTKHQPVTVRASGADDGARKETR